MPKLETKARSLSQLYVFYERLKDDGYLDLYGYVNNALDTQGSELYSLIYSASVIRTTAQREAIKEQNLLNKIFNVNIDIDLNDNNSIKQLIDTLNACLGLKEVYERNIFLIKNSEGKKSAISFFHTPFLRVWNNKWPIILREIESKISNGSKKQNILTLVEQTIDNYMPNIVSEAIEQMLQSNPELSSMPENMKDAYSSLLMAIGNIQNKGSLANQIYDIYNLGNISKTITENLKDVNKKKIKQELQKISINSIVEKDIYSRGGLTLEAIENAVFQMFINGIKSIPGVRADAYSTGAEGVKADNILTFNIDSEVIEQVLETNEAVSRQRNIEMFDKLGERLKNIKNGYIIYSSDKNYSYNKGFKGRGGFGAEKISLETYKNIMSTVNNNISTFIGTILQTTKGAVGEHGLKDTLEAALAQDIAYFLFDDFQTIGNEVGAEDTQAIHIMDLNGVLIPLSFFLTLFARAIEDVAQDPRDIVKATIRPTKILFPTPSSQTNWEISNKGSAWNYQREVAIKETQIEIHFLKEFKDIISQYL